MTVANRNPLPKIQQGWGFRVLYLWKEDGSNTLTIGLLDKLLGAMLLQTYCDDCRLSLHEKRRGGWDHTGTLAKSWICDLAQKPSNVSFAQAASLPLVGLTAWQRLMVDGKLQSEWNVLITGCTGGIGSIAV